jgi:hypothetical protein
MYSSLPTEMGVGSVSRPECAGMARDSSHSLAGAYTGQ